MSLGDIAELARVRRPVVSTWRRRQTVAGEPRPFPTPATTDGGRALFKSTDVVEWLERTGRGNNPQARADALAHTGLPATPSGSVPALDAATSLLCLKAVTGTSLSDLTPDDLLDLADETDPDDGFLFREVEQVGPDLEGMAAYVEELTDAAYDVSGALDRLLARAPAPSPGGRATALAPGLLDCVGSVVSALAHDLGRDQVTIVDATAGGSALLGAAMEAIGEHLEVAVQLNGNEAAARAMRRTGYIRGWRFTESLSPQDAAVVVGQFPHAGRPDLTAAEVLTAVDDVQLELGEGQHAIVLGPAAVLCDRLRDAALDGQRDHLVRLGRLRIAARLPQGLVIGQSRQSLALWAVGSDDATPIGDRWLATADLTDVTLTPDVVDDLVTDVVAATGPRALARAHAFRVARVSRTASLLAGRGALVPTGVRPARVAPTLSSEQVVVARELVDELFTGAPIGTTGDVQVNAASRADPGTGSVVLEKAVDKGLAKVLPGTRIAVDGVAPGTVRVFTADDLGAEGPSAGDDGSRQPTGLDPLDLEARHPGVRRTEPGDVVFCTSPRPRAVVDRDGLSVVAYPARVLRCGPGAGLVPEAVAWAINDLPDRARHWRAWRMPVVPAHEAAHLAEALRRVAAERQQALRRVDRLDRLAHVLVAGASAGALSIDVTTPTAEPSTPATAESPPVTEHDTGQVTERVPEHVTEHVTEQGA